ncbi:MAG: DUF3576 domain-containing protein [Rhodospirillaceae bacterium]|nr:DUF3576 domain-containing protein [Rhodospirillaceae bacterium]
MGRRVVRILAASAVLGLGLSACGSSDTYQAPVTTGDRGTKGDTVFSSGGLFNNSKSASSEGVVAVNAFLWRATLDTLAFMPLASADPFGGVIISDWYAPPETPDERFKVNVYILGRALRADGVKVSVFRQNRDTAGRWNDAAVGPEVGTEFENAVLTRARDLRLRATTAKE